MQKYKMLNHVGIKEIGPTRLKSDFVDKSRLTGQVNELYNANKAQVRSEIAVLILARNLIKRCKFERAENLIESFIKSNENSIALANELKKIKMSKAYLNSTSA